MGRLVGLRLQWQSIRTDASLSEEELEEKTRGLAKAIIQTIQNRELNRPELASAAPGESAVAQRDYDRDTVRRFRENIAPQLDDVRTEWIARGDWPPDLETRSSDPASLADLRGLAIGLWELAESS